MNSKAYLIVFLIIHCFFIIEAQEKTVRTYIVNEKSKVNLFALQDSLQGMWGSKSSDFPKIIIKDSTWITQLDDSCLYYHAQLSNTMSSSGEEKINIILFKIGKDWDHFKGKTEKSELHIYFLKSLTSDTLELTSVFNNHLIFYKLSDND